jgi:hypothetical protein
VQAKSNKGKTGRVPQKSVKSNRKRIERKSQSDGRRKLFQGKAAGTIRPATPFTLKPITKKLSGFEVRTLQGGQYRFSDPDDQLKAISKLYPVIKAIPGFKEIKNISSETTPGSILHNLLEQFEELTESEGWELSSDYKLSGIEQHGCCDAEWISISFLSKINRSHPKLHDLLLYSFMLVHKINGIGLYYDWVQMNNSENSMGMNYDYLFNRNDEEAEYEEVYVENTVYSEWLDYYGPGGIPVAYLKLMGGGASYKIWKKEFDNFRPSDAIGRAAMEYLRLADKIISTKMNISDYCYNQYNEGLTPLGYMRFIWSWEERDQMWQMHVETTDDWANNLGVLPFQWKCDYSNPPDNKKIREFCDLVRSYFVAGLQMSHWMNDNLKNLPELKPIPNKKKKNKNVYLINSII